MARTSGTTAATTAPNAISRIRNVSGIVSRSDQSRSSLTRLVDLVVGEGGVERRGSSSAGWAARDRVDRRPGPARAAGSGPRRSPGSAPTIRTVGPVRRDESRPRPARSSGSTSWSNGRAGRAVDRRLQRAERRDDARDGRPERGIVDGAGLRDDDEKRSTAGVAAASVRRLEHVVGAGPDSYLAAGRARPPRRFRAARRDARRRRSRSCRRTTGRRPASGGGRSSRRPGRSRASRRAGGGRLGAGAVGRAVRRSGPRRRPGRVYRRLRAASRRVPDRSRSVDTVAGQASGFRASATSRFGAVSRQALAEAAIASQLGVDRARGPRSIQPNRPT